jgi:hypothetical protein
MPGYNEACQISEGFKGNQICLIAVAEVHKIVVMVVFKDGSIQKIVKKTQNKKKNKRRIIENKILKIHKITMN